MNQDEIEAVNQTETIAETTPAEEPVKEKIEMKNDASLESGSGDAKKNEPEAEETEKAINGDCKANEEQSETAINGSDELNKTNDENGVEDITDAMMENIKENFNQDIDSMVNLMESAEDFMFDKSEDKQKNIKAATEANQHRQQQQESQSAINSDKSEAYSLLAQGKRNLFIKDYESAVSLLGEACEKLCSIYGDFALELGDAYMTYGSALLELWRIEEGEKPKNEEAKGADDNEENEDEDEPNEVEETEENDAEDDTKNNEGGDDEENDEGEEQNNEEDGEDIQNDDDNLQIAWEVTELARNIYLKHNDNLNLAKVHLKLGEISIACGNYDGAIEELNKSLEIQEKLTPVDKRLKANTHFNLSVVYASYPDYDKCDEELNIAKSVFESQLDDLNDKLKTLDKSKTSEINKIKSEISDAEEILQDLKSKILENSKNKRELMASAYEVIKKKLSEQSNPSNTISVSNGLPGNSSSAPVNNISHLVRREPKQKQEPSTESHHSPLKQTLIMKNSSSQNGVSSSNDESKPTNGSQECEIADGKTDECETNEKKRKLSASEEDTSAKKACLRPEDS